MSAGVRSQHDDPLTRLPIEILHKIMGNLVAANTLPAPYNEHSRDHYTNYQKLYSRYWKRHHIRAPLATQLRLAPLAPGNHLLKLQTVNKALYSACSNFAKGEFQRRFQGKSNKRQLHNYSWASLLVRSANRHCVFCNKVTGREKTFSNHQKCCKECEDDFRPLRNDTTKFMDCSKAMRVYRLTLRHMSPYHPDHDPKWPLIRWDVNGKVSQVLISELHKLVKAVYGEYVFNRLQGDRDAHKVDWDYGGMDMPDKDSDAGRKLMEQVCAWRDARQNRYNYLAHSDNMPFADGDLSDDDENSAARSLNALSTATVAPSNNPAGSGSAPSNSQPTSVNVTAGATSAASNQASIPPASLGPPTPAGAASVSGSNPVASTALISRAGNAIATTGSAALLPRLGRPVLAQSSILGTTSGQQAALLSTRPAVTTASIAPVSAASAPPTSAPSLPSPATQVRIPPDLRSDPRIESILLQLQLQQGRMSRLERRRMELVNIYEQQIAEVELYKTKIMATASQGTNASPPTVPPLPIGPITPADDPTHGSRGLVRRGHGSSSAQHFVDLTAQQSSRSRAATARANADDQDDDVTDSDSQSA